MNEHDKHDRNLWRLALRFLTLGSDLAVPIFGGVLLGHLLDRELGTGYAFTVGLLLLGIGVGYYNVVRAIQRLQAHDQRVAAETAEERPEREGEPSE